MIKEFIDEVISYANRENAYSDSKIKYTLILNPSGKEGGSYSSLTHKITNQTENLIEIGANKVNKEEVFKCIVLHELAHMLDYTKNGESSHGTNFLKTFKDILIYSFNSQHIDPAILCFSARYLANYEDANFVISVCLEYMKSSGYKPCKNVYMTRAIKLNAVLLKELKDLGFTSRILFDQAGEKVGDVFVSFVDQTDIDKCEHICQNICGVYAII